MAEPPNLKGPLTKENIQQYVEYARQTPGMYWNPIQRNFMPLKNAYNRVHSSYINNKGYDRIVYWPDYLITGSIQNICKTFNNAGISQVDVGELYRMSNGQLGQPKSRVWLTPQVIAANAIDPLNPEHLAWLNNFLAGPSPVAVLPIVLFPHAPYFKTLRDDGILLDATFNVGTHQIQAHKVVMAAASDYFRNLFASSYQEASQNEFTITEVDPTLFDLLIQSIYGFDLSTLDWQTQLDLMKLINFYQFHNVDLYQWLNQLNIPSQGFQQFLNIINDIYGGIPENLINTIALKVKSESDLASLPGELAQNIMSSANYYV